MSAVALWVLLPSLTNLSVFYIHSVLLLLLFSVSSYALLLRLRTGRTGARSAPRLRTRLAVLLPAWLLWAVWVGFGAYWLGLVGLLAGGMLWMLVAVAAIIVFVLFSLLLVYWLRGRVWADAGMVVTIAVAVAVVAVKYTLWLCEPLGHSGFAAAQICTGRLYAEGRGGALIDPQVSMGWYRRAAEAGNAEAQFILGTTIPARQEQEHWLRRATEQRHGPAAYTLYAQLGQRDEDLAWLHLAVDRGHPDALYRLAIRLIGGSGMARDLPRARTLLHTAAAAGSAGAMRRAALAYAGDGILFDHSDELSRQWESRALAAAEPDRRAPIDERISAGTFRASWSRSVRSMPPRTAAIPRPNGPSPARSWPRRVTIRPWLPRRTAGWNGPPRAAPPMHSSRWRSIPWVCRTRPAHSRNAAGSG